MPYLGATIFWGRLSFKGDYLLRNYGNWFLRKGKEKFDFQVSTHLSSVVFQKILKPNQTLKYEKFVSYRVQTWYFEQYSLDIEWERPFLRILTWLQVFKLFAKTLLSLIFPRSLFRWKLIKTEKNNTVLLSVLLQNWY